jgi:hypothetical protein
VLVKLFANGLQLGLQLLLHVLAAIAARDWIANGV